MNDHNAIVATHLKKTGTGLYTLCGARIYPPPGMPRPLDNTAAVSFLQVEAAGDPLTYPTHERTGFEFVSWGKGPKASRAVARALHDVLDSIEAVDVTVSGSKYRITLARRLGANTEEPDLENPEMWLTVSRYEITFLGGTVTW
jgi:hypothetical protein